MRDSDIGDVIVVEDGQVTGILTDRDIVVRAVAEGRDAESTSVSDICTTRHPGDRAGRERRRRAADDARARTSAACRS